MKEIVINRYGGVSDVGSFASTPITPPIELFWVFLIFVIAYTAWDFIVLNNKVKTNIILMKNVEYLLFFVFIFLIIGSFNFKSGLPIPLGNAYYDLHWKDVGGIFLTWNLWGLILFVFCKIRFCHVIKVSGRNMAKVIFGNVTIYIIALMPFVFLNALTRGNIPEKLKNDCKSQMIVIGNALYIYSLYHNDRLPESKNIEELVVALRPYIKDSGKLIGREDDSEFICPVDYTYKKHPEPYVWNPFFSGKTIDEIRKLCDGRLCGGKEIIHCKNRHLRKKLDVSLSVDDLLMIITLRNGK